MKPQTRAALESSRKLLQMGLDRAQRQLDTFEEHRRRGSYTDENTWRYYYDLGVKAFHDVAKLAALEMRDEAAEERREKRNAEPVSAGEALKALKGQLEDALEDMTPRAEAAQPGAAAKDDKHAPDSRPKLHMSALREAWTASGEWVQLAAQMPAGGNPPPLPHKVCKVLPALGVPEQEPERTMRQFREEAARLLNLQTQVA